MAVSKQKKFKDIFAELAQLSQWFSGEDMDIDEALKKYERGMELLKLARAELKTRENKFSKIEKAKSDT